MVEGNMLVLQFLFDGTETANHDVLPDTRGFGIRVPVIAARSDEGSVPFVGL